MLHGVRNPGGVSCLRYPPGSFCFQGICCAFLLALGTIDVAHITDVGAMDLHGLRRVFRPLHALFVDHDFPDEQPQQFRRQFRNVCIPSGFGDEAVGARYLIPQVLNGGFFFRNLILKSSLSICITTAGI